HDALAARLATRASIDLVKRAAIVGFVAFIAFGLSAKLAFDRWAPDSWWPAGVPRPDPYPGAPFFFILAALATGALVAFSLRDVRRARRLMREEQALFERLLALRAALGLDR
ncbi:MAG TPA: hypothetical protein VLS93_08755, partial [Anaeromyxobacteraceae bacterium]|nr:hypothetical protein [Anaeromyxobacteraceae bacterium]